jgi:hypothetical protein
MAARERLNTYSSKVLRFALCDPRGLPVFVASSINRALSEYVDMRGGILLNDDDAQRWWSSLQRSKWTIRNAHIECSVGAAIKELPNGKDKTKHVQKEGREHSTPTSKGQAARATKANPKGRAPGAASSRRA